MVGQILGMLGHQLDEKTLAEIIAEVDDDGSGQIEFEEFCTLAAKFLIEEDAEAMQQELKEAFRLYDKEGKTQHAIKSIIEYSFGVVKLLLTNKLFDFLKQATVTSQRLSCVKS